MKDQVAVIGVGCTKFGDLFETGYEDPKGQGGSLAVEGRTALTG